MIFVLAQRESHWCLTTQTCLLLFYSSTLLLFYSSTLLLFYSSTSLVPINKHLSQGDSVGFPGVIFGCDFQVGFSGVIFGCDFQVGFSGRIFRCKKRVDFLVTFSVRFISFPQVFCQFRLPVAEKNYPFQAGRFFSYISGFFRFLTILGGSITILGGSIFQLSPLVSY